MSLAATLPIVPESGVESPSGSSTRGSHRLAAIEVCPRAWDLRYVQGRVAAIDVEHRIHGSLIHLGMAYYFASKFQRPPPWFFKKDLHTALADLGRGFPKLIPLALEVLSHYMQYYSADPFQPVTVEHEFTAALGELDPLDPNEAVDEEHHRYLTALKQLDNEIISCRPDMVYRDGIGRLWVLDYKSHGRSYTTKKGKLVRWKPDGEFALNWQILINLHIVRKRFAEHVHGFYIQRITRLKDEQGRYDFDRHEVAIPIEPYSLAPRIARELVYAEKYWRHQSARGIEPRAHFWACYGRYGPCDYRPACLARSREERASIIARDYMQVEVSQI